MFLLTKKKGLSQISDLDFYLKKLEQEKTNETQSKNKKINNDKDRKQ